MHRAPSWMVLAAAIAILSAMPVAPAGAVQQVPSVPLEIKIGGHAGAELFTSFLEQSVGNRERELNAQISPMFGASIALSRGPLTDIRIAADWAHTEIEFEDDTGDDSDELDEEGLAELNLILAQLALVRYVLTPDRPVAPYFTLGFDMVFWMLDEEAGGAVGAEDETQLRYGVSTGVGLRFRVDPRLGIHVEIDRALVGNPFDGNTSFRVGGDTFDEPSAIGVTRFIGGVSYTL